MNKVLIAAGSSRQGAWSGKLAAAAAQVARDAGAQVTMLDLRTLALPLYDADLEASSGIPDGARQLRDLFATHDALLFTTPEYNGFPTPLFTNAFDWLSRVKAEGDTPAGLAATAGKVAGLTSSSPGALGGLRALNYARQYLQMAFAMHVVPKQFALGQAHQAFDESGELKEERHRESLQAVVKATLALAAALKAGATGAGA